MTTEGKDKERFLTQTLKYKGKFTTELAIYQEYNSFWNVIVRICCDQLLLMLAVCWLF